MDDDLSDDECRDLLAGETGWVRELARRAGLGGGEMFAIAVHLPGKPTLRQDVTVPVFDLFLGVLPDQDVLVRREREE